MRPNLGGLAQVLNLLPIAAVTTSASGSAVDLAEYDGEIAVIADVSAPVAGSSPTLDIKITECDTSGGSYTDVASGSFTQVTSAAAAQKITLDSNSLKRFIKVARTIGGTSSPQYLMSVKAVGYKKVIG